MFTNILTYVETAIPTWCYLQHILKIHKLNMFYDNDSQLVVNLDYQLDRKELDFLITKTLFIGCYTIKCDLSLDSLQHNVMHYIIALRDHSLSQRYFKQTN